MLPILDHCPPAPFYFSLVFLFLEKANSSHLCQAALPGEGQRCVRAPSLQWTSQENSSHWGLLGQLAPGTGAGGDLLWQVVDCSGPPGSGALLDTPIPQGVCTCSVGGTHRALGVGRQSAGSVHTSASRLTLLEGPCEGGSRWFHHYPYQQEHTGQYYTKTNGHGNEERGPHCQHIGSSPGQQGGISSSKWLTHL